MSAAVDITHLAPINCPPALRDLPAWVIWRFEDNLGGGKPRKVPWYAAGGRRYGEHGTPEDRRQLVTFDQARTAAAKRGFDGVGFATLADFGVCALDFDNCVDDAGTIQPEVQEVLGTTYAELSPSGHGVRAFFRGQLGNRKSNKGHAFGMETFSTRGFVTFTGNTLDICQILGNEDQVAPVDEPVLALYGRRFSREIERQANLTEHQDRLGLTQAQLALALSVLPDDLPYEDDSGPSWLGVGMALHHETEGEGFELWDTWSQRSSKYTTREYGWARWCSFSRGTGQVMTARSLVHWANEHGAGIDLAGPASAEEFDSVEPPASAEELERMRFQVIPAGEFADRPPPEWIVKGVVPQAELMVVFGASGSGKTFAVLDIVGAISRGVPWRGKRVKQGRVVYIAAEGAGGFRNRLKAYAQQHSITLADIPIGVIADAPNLLLKPDALDVTKAIKAYGGADVIVVDTFAQATPGADENAGQDIGKALAHCKGLHRATGALVILVHHAGKDLSKGARGWSGLRAAADAELSVERLATGRVLRTTKQKDGDDGLEWGFDLEVVPVGIDSDGDQVTSCVVVEAQVPSSQALRRPMGAIEKAVNEVIQEFAQAQTTGIEVGAVIAEAVKRLPEPEDGKRDTRKQRVRRALSMLCEGSDAPYWLDTETQTLQVM